jgi:hypothetical protein
MMRAISAVSSCYVVVLAIWICFSASFSAFDEVWYGVILIAIASSPIIALYGIATFIDRRELRIIVLIFDIAFSILVAVAIYMAFYVGHDPNAGLVVLPLTVIGLIGIPLVWLIAAAWAWLRTNVFAADTEQTSVDGRDF